MTTGIKVLKTNGIDGLKIHEVGKNRVTKITDDYIATDQNFMVGYSIYINEQLRYSYTNGVYEAEYYNDEEEV